MANEYELLPGTSLPLAGASERIGTGAVNKPDTGEIQIIRDRAPVSLFEKLSQRDDLTPGELLFVDQAIRAMDVKRRSIKTIFQVQAGVTDGTTGNLVQLLFNCPFGCEGKVTNVTIDAPNSATINPSAPFSNAASFAYLAITSQAGVDSNANADRYRGGLVAFAPTSAAGPFIPGQWTFNHNASPAMQGGDQLHLIIHGGSIAALLALTIQATFRIELEGLELATT